MTNRFRKTSNDSLASQVHLVQQGDTELQNQLIDAYKPFIAKAVSEVCKRYIDPTIDDEFSIGLSAFNEAMLAYSSDKGSAFLSFAKLVIKRKVIDYIRHDQTRLVAASLDETYDEEQMDNPLEISAAKAIHQEEIDQWHRREELLELELKLREYKISFKELTVISPKHQDARESAIEVARLLYEDSELREYVYKKRKIPIKSLVDRVKVSKKTLERNRKYILAIFIILSEDFLYLRDYLKGVGQ
ncbi:RNA polymerase sigma factor SigI [Radiobacillus kanasensis]|uniref:RNA polymerase sigma factor SigI n=1 Tax=Radiobacillus kanasensis TaxID=2844358 RepID=UPI001E53A14B|nr:RNA polymerase sigma factor SigI [Radiobacillus kanasensis]UFU01332.1 RNA polymerase sigma factor SigI [Radiobacillus kanasensis]